MKQEMDALYKNHTWDLLPCPPYTNIIGSQLIFKIKLREDRSMDRYKPHLVAQDYSQIEILETVEMREPEEKTHLSGWERNFRVW